MNCVVYTVYLIVTWFGGAGRAARLAAATTSKLQNCGGPVSLVFISVKIIC